MKLFNCRQIKLQSLFKVYFLMFNLLSATQAPSGVSDWTILIYAQAKNSLSSFAHKNFNDMSLIGSNKDLNILVQWYQPGQQGIWRYKIEKGKMNLDSSLQTNTDGTKAQDLVDSMQWAVSKYPAKKYALVLWNHGIGILDPAWGHMGKTQFINPAMLLNNPRIQIAGITTKDTETKVLAHAQTDEDSSHRGILFNEHSKTYMDNQNLSKALSDIKKTVLNNKKLDLLGMDACLMAMVEVGYQVRDYANFMVGSQEVELASGWNYSGFLQGLAYNKLSAIEAAQAIVLTYESYYKDKIQFYTQSAIDLSKMQPLKQSIDLVLENIQKCVALEKIDFGSIVRIARSRSLQFSTASYIDLHSFFAELSKQVDDNMNRVKNKRNQRLFASLSTLKASLTASSDIIDDVVVANTKGKLLTRAKGLSIYFPQGGIDRSYPLTEFAQESSWHKFLQDVLRK